MAGGGTRVGRASRLVAAGVVAAIAVATLVVVDTPRPGRIEVGSRTPGSDVARCPWLRAGLSDATRTDELLRALPTAGKLRLLRLAGGGASGLYEGYTESVASACVPEVTEQDGSEGVASGYSDHASVHRAFAGATQLPAPIADAAAWDPGLARAYGRVIGREAADKGIDVVLAPTVNIDRSPRWGRSYESLGEDPYLTASVAVPEIEGIQRNRVVAVVKHFAAYNQETHRDSVEDDSAVSARELHEIELPAFRAAVETAHVGGVMCSLNLVNGVPACEDKALLQTVLRGQWHFTGFVRSDCGAVYSTAAALAAGLSQAKCTPAYRPGRVAAALAAHQITLARIDAVLRPLLEVLFRFDLIAAPHRLHTGSPSSAGDRAVALRVAEEGTVLLRNRGGTLPLRTKGTVALIGPVPGGPSSSGGGALFVRPTATTTAAGALRADLGDRLRTDPGTDPASAAALAARSDTAVVIVGDHDREGRDRTTLSLGARQNALVRAVTAANPHTVVVVESGSAVLMPWLARTGAVLETWYHGQLGGTALADVLLGRYDPSGKLPVTFPRSDRQGPATTAATFGGVDGVVDYREGVDVGYRWYGAHHQTPLFPFGFGLSYTRFRFSALRVTGSSAAGLTVEATVRNVGSVAGAEVAQVYVGDPAATGEAPRQLRGFVRVELRAGQAARVRLTVTPGDLAVWSASGWSIAAGRYRILVGDGSAPSLLPLRASVDLRAERLGADSGPAPGPAPVVSKATPAPRRAHPARPGEHRRSNR